MRITLVGKRKGRRVICWKSWFRLTVATVLLGALMATAAYLLLARRWNPMAPLLGVGAGLAASLLCVLASLFTPLTRLPVIGDRSSP
ncbi:MAG: hypothetical protein JXQ71_15375 [Verrucomicrobia bacterium]|nr:hypothetical protein [Verrucomicrobiota bacterium]